MNQIFYLFHNVNQDFEKISLFTLIKIKFHLCHFFKVGIQLNSDLINCPPGKKSLTKMTKSYLCHTALEKSLCGINIFLCV